MEEGDDVWVVGPRGSDTEKKNIVRGTLGNKKIQWLVGEPKSIKTYIMACFNQHKNIIIIIII